jgi:hypothetical protein
MHGLHDCMTLCMAKFEDEDWFHDYNCYGDLHKPKIE